MNILQRWVSLPPTKMQVRYYNRIVDVMEELVKFTLLTRDMKDHLVDRYSEQVESRAELSQRVNQPKAVGQ